MPSDLVRYAGKQPIFLIFLVLLALLVFLLLAGCQKEVAPRLGPNPEGLAVPEVADDVCRFILGAYPPETTRLCPTEGFADPFGSPLLQALAANGYQIERASPTPPVVEKKRSFWRYPSDQWRKFRRRPATPPATPVALPGEAKPAPGLAFAYLLDRLPPADPAADAITHLRVELLIGPDTYSRLYQATAQVTTPGTYQPAGDWTRREVVKSATPDLAG
jgi:hypothetical protein